MLAEAGAIRGLAGHRHRARWQVAGIEHTLPLFADVPSKEEPVVLRLPSQADDVWADYAMTGQSLGAHPISFVRSQLKSRRCCSAREVGSAVSGTKLRFAGLVTMRQQPSTASGVTFITLEDEVGVINAVIWQAVAQRHWRAFQEAQLLGIDGVIERNDGVQHFIAERLHDYTALLSQLDVRSRDFR